ncbi:Histone deacetylase 15 [Datura stramonium]|uniref:histone deacetylase n=1 Tax=Datura stramonium TaxID=4076 RepID=A0ABS8WX81_DATST|nr:Histone deacetylase 15 [Datura stramonium]
MGAEGYCVNIPWSRGGVSDNDYILAFEQVVLPIALDFNPDFTIISAGFDAARGDPLGCCDVTPAGYASMTQMLSVLSGGKLLVILEGGYNLRSISSSATAVIKVLLGESPVIDVENTVPSKAGLRSVLDVLKIQMNFWPTLETNFTKLHSKWGSYAFLDARKQSRKRRRTGLPIWWRWGRKRWLYRILAKQLRAKSYCNYS